MTKVCNAIHNSLNAESLLLRIERSKLRWFGHVSRMPQERLPKQALSAIPNGIEGLLDDQDWDGLTTLKTLGGTG